ncbi:hypothetical protein Pmar_PMAR002829 [Perkinsus marinus ATCC 50983]|uniref:Chromo domain-containing protein n=1 Tax=Perkinsus marinus (strain ATCC 50983 / TXsc) TaxID=423536 RepID=C5LQN0_PERM5|nr:hypothetical protein Pmar_PMAR002829 [Perkinsus marinus ATCC 50983]EER00765.1 hypothetical protein Pmar_PMAR002829 [Perkinsus marinus ATCC 50983]|eukprot:XP_002768047.1 hypothetical protein Pmar_PMAR002829 [Perkinsus marinus ATCC 50983]
MNPEIYATNTSGLVHSMTQAATTGVPSTSSPPSSPSSGTGCPMPAVTPAALAALSAWIQKSSRNNAASAAAAAVKPPPTTPAQPPAHLSAKQTVNAALIDRLRAEMRVKAAFTPAASQPSRSTPVQPPPPPERQESSTSSGWLPTVRIAGALCAHQGCFNNDLAWNDTVPEAVFHAGNTQPMYAARSRRGNSSMATFGLCATHYREIKLALSMFQRSNLPTEYLVSTLRALDQARGVRETARREAFPTPPPERVPSNSSDVMRNSSVEAAEVVPKIDVEVVGSDDEDDGSDVFEAIVVTDAPTNDPTVASIRAEAPQDQRADVPVAADTVRDDPARVPVAADTVRDDHAGVPVVADTVRDDPARVPVVAEAAQGEHAEAPEVTDTTPNERARGLVVADTTQDEHARVPGVAEASQDERATLPVGATAFPGESSITPVTPDDHPKEPVIERVEADDYQVGGFSIGVHAADGTKDGRDEASVSTTAGPSSGRAVEEATVGNTLCGHEQLVQAAAVSSTVVEKPRDTTSGEASKLVIPEDGEKLEDSILEELHGKRRLSSTSVLECTPAVKRKRKERRRPATKRKATDEVKISVAEEGTGDKSGTKEPSITTGRGKENKANDEARSVRDRNMIQNSNASCSIAEDAAKEIASEADEEEEEVFAVEKLLKWKLDNRGRRKFLVKWEGYPLSEASWEPETNLNSSIEIDELKAAVLTKPPSIGRRSHAKKISRRF